jgi:hypothetical protein
MSGDPDWDELSRTIKQLEPPSLRRVSRAVSLGLRLSDAEEARAASLLARQVRVSSLEEVRRGRVAVAIFLLLLLISLAGAFVFDVELFRLGVVAFSGLVTMFYVLPVYRATMAACAMRKNAHFTA